MFELKQKDLEQAIYDCTLQLPNGKGVAVYSSSFWK
jgi:hypothetical protein